MIYFPDGVQSFRTFNKRSGLGRKRGTAFSVPDVLASTKASVETRFVRSPTLSG